MFLDSIEPPMERKTRLARLLLDKSYIEGQVTLTSGRTSDYYFDCKQTALHPEGAYLVGHLLFDRLQPGIQGVAGMTLGADPLVSAVILVSHLRGWPVPGCIVRKKSKGHGTNQYLEGMANFERGDRIALLEDVVTTGGSVLKACQRVQEAGLNIVQVLCILDREEGGREALQDQGFELETIFTRAELLKWGRSPDASPSWTRPSTS